MSSAEHRLISEGWLAGWVIRKPPLAIWDDDLADREPFGFVVDADLHREFVATDLSSIDEFQGEARVDVDQFAVGKRPPPSSLDLPKTVQDRSGGILVEADHQKVGKAALVVADGVDERIEARRIIGRGAGHNEVPAALSDVRRNQPRNIVTHRGLIVADP